MSKLVSFKNSNNNITQGTGYYGETDRNSAVNCELKIDPNYTRGQKTGTDIYVMRFTDETEWEDEIVKSILEGFLVAIYDGEIELKVLIAPDLHKRALLSRSSGMKIFDKASISSTIHFAEVLTLKGPQVNKFFREMETPQHNAWESGFHSDKKKAKKARTELFQYIKETITQIGRNDIYR